MDIISFCFIYLSKSSKEVEQIFYLLESTHGVEKIESFLLYK